MIADQDVQDRRSRLTPAKQALLERRLRRGLAGMAATPARSR